MIQSGIAYSTYPSFEQAGHLQHEWDDLAGRTGDILCSYDWCELWWKHFGRWRQLEIHTLRDQERLVAVLPLFRETIRPGGVWLRTVRVVGCDYSVGAVGLAIEPAYLERFAGMLVDALNRGGSWDLLQIGPLRPYATISERLARACVEHANVQTVIHGQQDPWCTLFHLPRTYDQFLEALSKDERKSMRRRERQLAERHQVQVVAASMPAQVSAAMDALVSMHQKQWTEKGRTGQFGGIGNPEQFHRDLAERLVQKGRLVLLTLKVDGQTLAATYGYRMGPRTHGLFSGRCDDPRWQEYGLGKIIYSHLIRDATAHGSSVLEDGRGIFDYKLGLGGRLYGERSVTVVRRGWGRRLRFWLALRTAYLIHGVYARIWLDTVAPRLGLKVRGSHSYLRYFPLAQIFRRVSFRLLGGTTMLETRCLQRAPAEHLGDPSQLISPANDLLRQGGAAAGQPAREQSAIIRTEDIAS